MGPCWGRPAARRPSWRHAGTGIHLHVLMHGSRNFIAAKTGIDHAKDHGNMGEKDKEQQDEDMAFGIFLGVRAVTNKAELREKKQEGGDDAKDIGPDRDKVDGAPPLNGGDVARNKVEGGHDEIEAKEETASMGEGLPFSLSLPLPKRLKASAIKWFR